MTAGPELRLPIVDVAGLRSSDAHERAAAVAALHDACSSAGFCYVEGHGVDAVLIEAAVAQARAFFELPLDAKAALDIAHSPVFRGYAPLQRQTLDPGTPPDRKESFALGSELDPEHPFARAGTFGYGANQWPAGLPAFRPAMDAYRNAMLELARTLFGGMARALDLPDAVIDGFTAEPVIAGLRLLRYPPHPADALPDETGCGAHTDWGALTVLLQDATGGLEIWDERRGWSAVPPVRGTFVINIGDLMARWTNDAYRSTRHRVINRSDRERCSLAFFFDGRADYVVDCVSSCLRNGEQPRYPPTTPAEHLQEMKRRSYASAASSAASVSSTPRPLVESATSARA